MTPRITALLCIVALGSALGADDPLEPSPQVMRQFGISYKQAVREARAKQERGLVVLLRLSVEPELDGARAETYSADIRELLDIWGDKKFAAVLRRQSAAVRKSMWRWLRDIGFTEFSRRYPEAVAASYP